LSNFEANFSKTLTLQKEGNGFYIMNIEGEILVNGEKLEKRDAVGIWETNEIEIKANSDSRFLIMEIPMEQ
jgi:redox-sensitive bicupin YhaK (pirin superfamily)